MSLTSLLRAGRGPVSGHFKANTPGNTETLRERQPRDPRPGSVTDEFGYLAQLAEESGR
jgi:hypothetical protein